MTCPRRPKNLSNTFTGENVRVKLFNVAPTTQEAAGWIMLQLVRRAGRSVFPVVAVGRLEHVLAGDFSFEFGANEEGAAHLPVEGVGFLWRRRQSLPQHHRDQAVDALGGALGPKVEGLLGGEGFAEDHHGVHVGVLHRLKHKTSGVNTEALYNTTL